MKTEPGLNLPAERVGSPLESPLIPAEAPEQVKRVLDAVGLASGIMKDLIAHGQNVSDVSESGIIYYRELATRALTQVDKLELERDTLREEIVRNHEVFAARVVELEAQILTQRKELDKLRLLVWPARRR